MDGTDAARALKYLCAVEWPKELRAGYTIDRKSGLITLKINKGDWVLLPPEDIIKATDTVNETMFWLVSNGYLARLESVV